MEAEERRRRRRRRVRRGAATCTISSGSLSAEAALSERRQFPISLEVEEDLRCGFILLGHNSLPFN